MSRNKCLSDYGFSQPIKKINKNEDVKMATIRQQAKDYESVKTKNISELKSVSTEMDIEEKEFQDQEGKLFTVSTINVDGQDYRVPASVLKSLKEILIDRPEIVKFKVRKSGEGMSTKYTVIPLE
jgi:hypothetical protein